MRYETFIGLRHLMSIRGSFLSTLTVLAVAGVAMSVAAFIAVVSVAGGFVDSFRDRVLGVNPHVVVTKYGVHFSEYREVSDRISQVDGVVSVSPFLLHEMLVTAEGSRARPGALVKGVDVDTLARDQELTRLVTSGSLDDMRYAGVLPDEDAGDDALIGVALGRVLAERVNADIGDVVTLLSPTRALRQAGIRTGDAAATWARFRVAAIIDSGFYDYDNRLVVVDYRALQDVFGRGDVVTGVDVRLDDVFATDEIKQEIDALLPEGRYRILDWQQINRNLFASLNLQKLVLTLVMWVLVVVSSMVIVCVLVMLVLEKRREIAIMRSMGATAGGVMRIFVVEGMTIGTVGTVLGLALGWVACVVLQRVDFGLEFEVYRIDALPVSMHPHEFALAGLGALLVCLVATLYPSRRAARVTPLDALRYD